MKRYIIDRFEEDFAVLEKEEGGTIDVEKSLLPGAQKGDIVIENDGIFSVDKRQTEKRKVIILKKLRRLFVKK